MPDYSDIPVEFSFDDYDVDEDMKKHQLLQLQINMGIKTKEMVAIELGIDIKELKQSRMDSVEDEKKMFPEQPKEEEKEEEDTKLKEKAEKPEETVEKVEKESDKILSSIDKQFDEVESKLIDSVEESRDWEF